MQLFILTTFIVLANMNLKINEFIPEGIIVSFIPENFLVALCRLVQLRGKEYTDNAQTFLNIKSWEKY